MLSYHSFPFVCLQDILITIFESGSVALLSLAEESKEDYNNVCLHWDILKLFQELLVLIKHQYFWWTQ